MDGRQMSKDMTPQEEKKVQMAVLNEIVLTCKMDRIDYFALDKPTRDVMISIFQTGAGFLDKYLDKGQK